MGIREKKQRGRGEDGAADKEGSSTTMRRGAVVGQTSNDGLHDETGKRTCEPCKRDETGGEAEEQELRGALVDLGGVADLDASHGTSEGEEAGKREGRGFDHH